LLTATTGGRVVKLIAAVALLIVGVVMALAYLHLNPILTFVIVSAALYLFSRKGDGSLWPETVVRWGSGHGIYLRRDDRYVAGIEPESTADKDRREAERR
jgi:hypothetical protein